MVSKIEPDRYADTGFSVKDTPPEINEMLFRRMMELSAGQRLEMGFSMMATARQMVWDTLPKHLDTAERRRAFYERFYGEPFPIPE